MDRIILTGDLHGDPKRLFALSMANPDLTKEDIVIVLGDFGVIWSNPSWTKDVLEYLGKELNFTLAFIDGNHENFDLIKEMEEIALWKNGYVGKLPGGVFHLLRGEIYTIGNRKVGVCGGANSVDMWHRVEYISWWKQENIIEKDIDNFVANLQKQKDNKIDLMLTHTCPASILPEVALYSIANGKNVPIRNCESKLEEINKMADICKWYFGHWHINMKFDNKFECLFDYFKEV